MCVCIFLLVACCLSVIRVSDFKVLSNCGTLSLSPKMHVLVLVQVLHRSNVHDIHDIGTFIYVYIRHK